MASGTDFKASLQEWKSEIRESLSALARQACQELSKRVVVDTPQDTGFLKSSWQPSLNDPSAGEGVVSPGAEGLALAKVALTVQGMKLGDKFYMTNNAVYAPRLEWGFVGYDSLGRYYNQQGRFFVTRNVEAWPSIVQEVANDLTT